MSATPTPTPVPANTAPSGERLEAAWHRKALEISVELTGLPALVTVIASFCTEKQRLLAVCAIVALMIAVGLRFLPGISKARSMSRVLPWLVSAILALTLVLVLVVLPYRAEKQNTLLATSWLEWQKSLEASAAKCKKGPNQEACLSEVLENVLEDRPKSPYASTKLASAVIAGQVLLANQSIHDLLHERLSVDERFIGAGNSEPVQRTNAAAAKVPEYLVPNLPDSSPWVWVWKVNPAALMNGSLVIDHKLIDVLRGIPPEPHGDQPTFAESWNWIVRDHLSTEDVPALVRFALLDPPNLPRDKKKHPPSGCLGKPEAKRVFMNALANVKDETIRTAERDSGSTVRPDAPDDWLYIWVYVPTQTGEVTRATWENVLANLPTWMKDKTCPVKPLAPE